MDVVGSCLFVYFFHIINGLRESNQKKKILMGNNNFRVSPSRNFVVVLFFLSLIINRSWFEGVHDVYINIHERKFFFRFKQFCNTHTQPARIFFFPPHLAVCTQRAL